VPGAPSRGGASRRGNSAQYSNAITAAAVGGIATVCAAHAETPLERGTYLMHGIVACGNCHTPKGPDFKPLIDQELGGGFVIEAPVFRAVASNITPDMETGIGGWTDDQIVEAIRNGTRPDGTTIGPPIRLRPIVTCPTVT